MTPLIHTVTDQPDMPDDVVLRVRDLTTVFDLRGGMFTAVDGVSLDLSRGKTLCLVGESGSGKSVCARSVMQLVDPIGRVAGGSIELTARAGEGGPVDIAKLAPNSREVRAIRGRDIAMVFQEPMSSLSPVHKIGQQITEVIRLHLKLDRHAARQRAIELLGRVEIANPEKAIDNYAFEFSGGMRQRAMIAMALACRPRVLIADEPTTALDVTTQADILDLLQELQDEFGMAVLMITHDMGVVAEIADDVAVMFRGRLVEKGPVEQIFQAPQHAYTKHLLGSVLRLQQPAPNRPAAPESSVPVLQVRDLTKAYGLTGSLFSFRKPPPVKAVNGVSFDLAEGETLGVVGESGSGKTTVGQLLLAITKPTGGSVVYRNRDGAEVEVGGLNKAGLRTYYREARFVFQDPFSSLNPRLTVKQVIADPLVVQGIAKGQELEDRVAELLRLVHLPPDAMERYPHAFSGGQRQRIGIARALALQPRMIVADEVTSGLDVSLRSRILDLLFELKDRLGLSFVFISHDISVVRYFCDRVAVMHKGRFVEVGEAEQITTEPEHPYTKALISAVPVPDPAARRLAQRHRYQPGA